LRRFRESYESGGVFGPTKALFKALFYFLGIFIAIGFLVFTVGVILLFATVTLRAEQTGALQTVYEYTDEALTKLPIFNLGYKYIKDTIKFTQDPSVLFRQTRWRGEVDKNSQNLEMGVEVNPLKGQTQNLVTNPIILTTTIRAALLKDTTINLKCTSKHLADDPNKIIQVVPESRNIVKGYKQEFSATCNIPRNFYEQKLQSAEIFTDTIDLLITYDFNTRAYTPLYLASKDYIDRLAGQDPFQVNGVQDPLIDSDRISKTRWTRGPIDLAIDFRNTQPITEEYEDYIFIIGIKKSLQWLGSLNKINSITLYLPKNLELKDNEQFKFDKVGGGDEEGYNKYVLNEDSLNNINNYCSNLRLSKIDCDNYWENFVLVIPTGFKISSLEIPYLDQKEIRVEVDYQFSAKTTKTISIFKTFAT